MFPKVKLRERLRLRAGPVIKCFVIPQSSKLKTAKKLFALLWLADKFASVSRNNLMVHVVVFPGSYSEFCLP